MASDRGIGPRRCPYRGRDRVQAIGPAKARPRPYTGNVRQSTGRGGEERGEAGRNGEGERRSASRLGSRHKGERLDVAKGERLDVARHGERARAPGRALGPRRASLGQGELGRAPGRGRGGTGGRGRASAWTCSSLEGRAPGRYARNGNGRALVRRGRLIGGERREAS